MMVSIDTYNKHMEKIADTIRDMGRRIRQLESVEVPIGGGAPANHNILSATHTDSTAAAAVRGDIITAQGVAPTWSRLAKSALAGSIVTCNANDVIWSTWALVGTAAQTYTFPPASANLVGGTGVIGYVAYWNGTNGITGEAQLFYDSGNNRLGINDATPSYTLDVNGIIGINDVQTIYNASALNPANFLSSLFIGNGGSSLSHTGGSEGMTDTGVGVNALSAITTGSRDTAIGATAGGNITIGYENVFIGALSGTTDAALDDVTSNSDCIYIGYNASSLVNGSLYEIVIGASAVGKGTNTTVIGTATATTDAYIYGNHIVEDGHFVGITADVRIILDATAGLIKAVFGDAVGADKVLFVDSATATVASIDSNGIITSNALTASTVIYSNASREITSLANGSGYLTNNGAGALSWSASATPAAHDVLSATHTDTDPDTAVRGDIITAQGTAPTLWTRLKIDGITGSIVTRDANDVLWSAYALVGTAAQTYTFGTTGGAIPTSAGTLTASTVNAISAAGVITHAITNTSDGDTTPSTILSTDANGTLRVRRLGVGVAAIAANGTIALPNAGYIGNGSATARLGFDSSGATDYAYFMGAYVGIGTATPSTNLHCYVASGNVLQTIETDSAGGAYLVLDGTQTVDAVVGTLQFSNAGDSVAQITAYRDGANDAAYLYFTTQATGGSATERMRITSTGNVLVGTTTDSGYRFNIGSGAMRLAEMSAPSAPGANAVVIYAEDNGAGKTRLMALFNTGAAQQIAIQP